MKTGQRDIRHDCANAQRLAGKALERVADETAATIGTDDVAHTDDLFTRLADQTCCDPFVVLREADEFAAELRAAPEFDKPLAPTGLVERLASAADRRLRQANVTVKGKAMTDAVDMARDRIGQAIFATWDERDVQELVRLMKIFADDIKGDLPKAQ